MLTLGAVLAVSTFDSVTAEVAELGVELVALELAEVAALVAALSGAEEAVVASCFVLFF